MNKSIIISIVAIVLAVASGINAQLQAKALSQLIAKQEQMIQKIEHEKTCKIKIAPLDKNAKELLQTSLVKSIACALSEENCLPAQFALLNTLGALEKLREYSESVTCIAEQLEVVPQLSMWEEKIRFLYDHVFTANSFEEEHRHLAQELYEKLNRQPTAEKQ